MAAVNDSDDIFGNDGEPHEGEPPQFAPRDPDMPDDALGLGLDPVPPVPGNATADGMSAPEPLDTPAPPAQDSVATAPVAKTDANAGGYRVLARKYRPQTFDELIGQDAMVQTLANAIKRDRLAHAFLMTGVRGVGKTSTARLIAKGLNCIGPDGQGGPTIEPCGACEPCRAIAEGRHIDVIEMDAASHTGVDDIREIIEAVRYSAVSARYKVYIIDEVHMLSKNAFNALLKTLEEPPAHVKFIFATTEVNKIPITVLSRCQRFDLKRIPVELLRDHFAEICAKEQVAAEEEALLLVAGAAEGSVRDGLSILDQAISHADMDDEGKVTAVQVRAMLGLSDRAATRRLLQLLLEGDVAPMLGEVKRQYQYGVEPLSLVEGLMRLTHSVTLVKSGSAPDITQSEEARAAESDLASRLSHAQLHRLWQLLLKGHEEVRASAMPIQACEMALLRIMHAAHMPDPDELKKLIESGAGVASGTRDAGETGSDDRASGQMEQPSAQTRSEPEEPQRKTPPPAAAQAPAFDPMPQSFEACIDLIEAREDAAQRDWELSLFAHDHLRLVDFAPGRIAYQAGGPEPRDFAFRLSARLKQWTGEDWVVEAADGDARASLREQQESARRSAEEARRNSPMVKAVLDTFPGSKLMPDDGNPDLKKASA